MPGLRSHVFEEQEAKFQLEILDDSDYGVRRFIQENRTGAREPEPCVIVLGWHLPRNTGTLCRPKPAEFSGFAVLVREIIALCKTTVAVDS
jgi:hypothetical protein